MEHERMEIKDYMKLPYTRMVQEMNDESGHYFYDKILELDGCQSTGDTLEDRQLPKSLHQRLAIAAEKEGVSLNQLALYKLAL